MNMQVAQNMGACISQLKSLKENFVVSGEEAACENVE